VVITYAILLASIQFVLNNFGAGSWVTTVLGFAVAIYYTGGYIEGFFIRNTNFVSYLVKISIFSYLIAILYFH